MPENKVQFGLSKAAFAPYTVTGGVVTFETPIPIPGAVSLTLDPRGELTEFYADNILYYVASSNQGYDASLEIATIPEQFAIEALGEVLDVTDGVITEVADAQGKPFAFLFQFEGDVKATRHVMFNCTANRPSISSSTKTTSTEPGTSELTLVSSPIEIDGKLLVKTKTTAATNDAIYNAWYTSVYEPTIVPTP
ncbi:MAG: major tail protein [Carnobacterium inhibens]|uniref:major tail protein n=1 Tax=Carnobacterium inhibens TaxID=147709 RepID=UPI003315710F